MSGTRDEWIGGPFQRRELTDHGRDQSLTVFDGHHAWKRDWNGFVEPLAGDDVRREVDFAIIHGFGALDGSAGDAEIVGPDVIRFHPAGGLPLTYTLDAATALPLKAEIPSFDGTLTTTFSDWREVNGLEVAFTETITNDVNTTTLKVRSVDFAPAPAGEFQMPASGPFDAFFTGNPKAERVPFNFDNNHIMILASVNGVGPIWFLVDTGAGFSIINSSRVGELGLTPYGGLQTIGGGTSATGGAYVDHVTYRIGDVELREQHAAVLELRGLEKLYGMPMGGLLGWDFLSRFVVVIDYAKRELVLHPRLADTAGEHGVHVALTMQGEQPYFAGSIVAAGETIPTWYILDVGAADTITFTTPFVKAHDLLTRVGDKSRTVHKVAAPDLAAYAPTNVRALMDGVTVGGITLPHVLVNLSVAPRGAYTSPAFSGNIGETILSRFSRVVLDYGRSEMILEEGARTREPFEERKTFGLTVIADGPALQTFTITAVGAGSSAERLGFRKGDIIRSIDATPATRMNLAAVKAVLALNSTDHTFRVQRADGEVVLSGRIELAPVSSLQ